MNHPPPPPLQPSLVPPVAPLSVGQRFLLPAVVRQLDYTTNLDGLKAVGVELAGCGWLVYLTEEQIRKAMK